MIRRHCLTTALIGCFGLCGSFSTAQNSVPPAPTAPVATESKSAARPSGPPPISGGPLGEIDQLFIQSYMARRAAVLQTGPPFVVVSGSNLILHRNGSTDSVRVIPDIYHALKDIAHIPFTIYLLLSPSAEADVPLSDSTSATLRDLLTRIDAVRKVLSTGGYTADELTRQKTILDASQEIVSAALAKVSIDLVTLTAFARKIGPLMLLNARDAGCAQIQATHAQMMRWKNGMSSTEWNRLVVVNRARHQARYRNTATQYFHWLFADSAPSWSYPGESMRVIYAESLAPGEDASDEFATILIDADASARFFQQPWRLSEDILSDGAEECIGKLQPSDRIHP